ncbi:hypothetical protein OOK41_10465 [Micromonospora sp. NBC_01655]|uniref:hypothetical protein n=1 Tax=Micromonospora sp. NBC_01655 TaxID=2975983 RepID=UPI00224F0FEF|nr:hypothetical protein [Micromonospora sp. NBC_01655]MCX4470723.1 hypothetical protein [Micromonospora sp. NBC_01655]
MPSVAEMTALVAADPVVRLPGSVARWNEQRVREAIGNQQVRILVAPPGLDKDERDRVRDVKNATLRVIGTEVSGGLYQAVADDLPGWRAQFATGDVTDLLVTLVAALQDQPTPPDRDEVRWREPTERELATVAADLRATGLHVGAGATLTRVPGESARHAFPDGARVVALPPQRDGAPLPRYGPALTGLFPGTPIVVMYGSWIEYHGPGQADFAELAGASFYGQFASRLSRYDYPQDNVLAVYLNRVTDIRYSGLFDRPLPYRPVDPLRVALPALPWVFAGCVAAFLVLSIRSLRRPDGGAGRRRGGRGRDGIPARLAGLTALAVEMSLLTDARSDPALTRGHRQAAGGERGAGRGATGTARPDAAEGGGGRVGRRRPHDGHHQLSTGPLPAGQVVVKPSVRRRLGALFGTPSASPSWPARSWPAGRCGPAGRWTARSPARSAPRPCTPRPVSTWTRPRRSGSSVTAGWW